MKKLIFIAALLLPLLALVPHAAFADTGTGQAFVPVSDIPAFGQAGAAPNLPTFLNLLYFYCIGIAVVIAVLQLARAGITYSLADSITSKEEARHLIGASVFGLILVLSPYIVFKLINPAILTLNINVSGLQTNLPNGVGGTQNGEQQAGLNQGQEDNGAKPIFDGTYMDFIEFDGTNDVAYKNATSYSCQTNGQTKNQFNNGGNAPYYVSCVTGKVSYMLIVGGGALTPDDQQRKDTFKGECNRLSSEQTSRNFDAYYTHLGGTSDSDPKVPCGDGQQCWQAYSTCTTTK